MELGISKKFHQILRACFCVFKGGAACVWTRSEMWSKIAKPCFSCKKRNFAVPDALARSGAKNLGQMFSKDS